MAKPLVFQLGEDEIALNLNKVDRTKLYGSKEVEAVDEHDQVCELATLAADGRTMIGRGGTGLQWLDADGNWCDKSQLRPIDVHGQEIRPVASSFGQIIKLFDTVTTEQYLDHNIRLVYWVEPAADSVNFDTLVDELRRGTVFSFPYSFRGGLEADVGFLLMNEEQQVMLTVGNPAAISFVTVQNQVAVEDQSYDSDDSEDELMSFNMI
jgi:hypothetical protein